MSATVKSPESGSDTTRPATATGHSQSAADPLADGTPRVVENAAAHRKKKRRGRRRSGQGTGAAQRAGEPKQAVDNAARPDCAPSAKGKKAANRRGRKRWQAGKSGGQNGQRPGEKNAAAAENKRPHTGGTQSAATPKAIDPPIQLDRADQPSQTVRRARPQNGDRPRNGLRRRALPSTGNSPLYAALDLGTNNCRLLIARPEERGFRVIDAYSRIVRLGEGVGAHRNLGEAAMDRAIDALAQCHKKLADRGVERSRLIATEACRAAENGEDFISRVQAETGLALEVVNRETEARLAVAGCASLVDHDADGVILFDIGGGSSEIVWLDLRNRCGARGYALTRFIRSWISLPVGVVNLAERHGGVHVTPDIFEKMVDDAADHLAEFNLADDLSEAIANGKVHMLGTSGTVTTLAGVHLGLRRYDRRRVDGTWLEDAQVGGMIDQLRDMPYEARVNNPCIGEDRADLVLAGCAILEAIRRRWTCPRLRVADRGLREGILTELMAADGVWSRKKNGSRYYRSRPRNRQ
ncbi:exopolyphosphatase [Labrenzia sp. PHM005]|uniref:Ppx/GppA phosphatase family protein n=1 Tax=Labrenzia sp. PHM005 TaxID=2590016 RepID=UPI00352E2C67